MSPRWLVLISLAFGGFALGNVLNGERGIHLFALGWHIGVLLGMAASGKRVGRSET